MAMSPHTVLVVFVAVRETPDLDQWSTPALHVSPSCHGFFHLDFLESAQALQDSKGVGAISLTLGFF